MPASKIQKENHLEIDKCTAHITFKVPQCLKDHYDALPDNYKRRVKELVMVLIAKVVHRSKFNANLYLSSD